MTLDELKKYLEDFLRDSDEVEIIEPFINDLLENKIKITAIDIGKEVVMTVDEVLESLRDFSPMQLYLDDIFMKKKFFSELESITKTWDCYANEDDKQVYSRLEVGSNIISLFYRFKCPTNMFYPLALFSEIDLFKDWIPDIIKSDIKQNLSNYRKTIHAQRHFPFPLTNRELFLCASTSFVNEKKGTLIMLRSLQGERQKHWKTDLPSEGSGGFVRA